MDHWNDALVDSLLRLVASEASTLTDRRLSAAIRYAGMQARSSANDAASRDRWRRAAEVYKNERTARAKEVAGA